MSPDSRREWRRQREQSASLRRGCEKRLAALDLPAEPDIVKLANHIGDRRGRPIILMPVQMQASDPYGLWIATAEADFIGYEANTSKHHQEHIIAHELGHMICCHRGILRPDEETVGLLFPDLDPQLIRELLRRTGYSDIQEEEAEIMASLIKAIAVSRTAPSGAGVLSGLESALGFRRQR
jgi:hypothetical protein